jgi:hypothetical protein
MIAMCGEPPSWYYGLLQCHRCRQQLLLGSRGHHADVGCWVWLLGMPCAVWLYARKVAAQQGCSVGVVLQHLGSLACAHQGFEAVCLLLPCCCSRL